MISVLYVDDEKSLLEIGRIYLEQTGWFRVTTATSAREGLEILGRSRLDAVISDYQMPEMNGIDFLKQVRAGNNRIPFIIFTGRGREEIVIQALNEGADFYLQKGGEPVSQFTELAHKIRQAVQQRRAEQNIRDLEQRQAGIINFLPDATLAIDTRGVVIAWNRAMERMTGIPAAEMLGKGNQEYALPFYHEKRPILIDLVLDDTPANEVYYPGIRREGRTLFAEANVPYVYNGRGALLWFTASPLVDHAGTVIGAIESIRDITEMRRAEEALKESEQRYRDVVEDQTEMICRFLPDATIVFVNEAFCRYFGFERSEILGRKFRPRIHPGDREAVHRFFASLTPGHPVDAIEQRILMQDGAVRWQQWSDRAIFGTDGAIREYQSVGRDITLAKETEKALRLSEERYRLVVENADEAIVVAQGDRLVYANPAALRLIGKAREELMGRPFAEFIHPDDRQMIFDRYARRVAGEDQPSRYDFRVITGSGGVRWVFISSVRIEWAELPATLNFLMNITEHRNAETALRESEKRMEQIIDFLPDATFAIDRDGTVIQWNRAMADMTGIAAGEMLGKGGFAYAVPFYGFPRPILVDLVFLPDDAVRKSYSFVRIDRGILTAETTNARPRGRECVLWGKAAPLYDSSGTVIGAIESIRDITEFRSNRNNLNGRNMA